MFKQAILVEGYGDPTITQLMINTLDSDAIDFYIHWDLKSKRPNFKAMRSKVYLIPRHNVYWGGQSLTFATLALLQTAVKNSYEFYHIVSGQDMTLMNKECFMRFFKKNRGTNFIDIENISKYIWRVKYYYFFEKVKLPRKIIYWLAKLNAKLQSFLRVNRLKNKNLRVGKGEHWASINGSLAKQICQDQCLRKIKNTFKYTFISDEIWLQTVFLNPKYFFNRDESSLNSIQASRFIDWKRGNPYMFSEVDFAELSGLFNSKYAFVRKVNPELATKIALSVKR